MRKVGVIGSGTVGQALANGLLRRGLDVTARTRDPKELDGWVAGMGGRGRGSSLPPFLLSWEGSAGILLSLISVPEMATGTRDSR